MNLNGKTLQRTRVKKITPLLLAGGIGRRLWPLSNIKNPKQFLKFKNNTLFEKTVARVSKNQAFLPPMIMANAAHQNTLQSLALHSRIKKPIICLEPSQKNTGPAIIFATLYQHIVLESDVPILSLPCDHLIPDHQMFFDTISAAANSPIIDNSILLFGVKPISAQSRFGYIKRGKVINNDYEAYKIEHFVEKPAAQMARAFLRTGDYFWNSGIYLFRPSVFIKELETHAPELLEACTNLIKDISVQNSIITWGNKATWQNLPSISIDHALIERTNNLAMLPLNTEWSDVGTWPELIKQTFRGNLF